MFDTRDLDGDPRSINQRIPRPINKRIDFLNLGSILIFIKKIRLFEIYPNIYS